MRRRGYLRKIPIFIKPKLKPVKNYKFIFFLCLLPFLNKAQVYSWAHSGNGAGGYCEGMDVAIDASSNVYSVGQYASPNVIFGAYTLTNAGNANAYLVKYDLNGNIQWARSAGGIYSDGATSVCTDAANNIFVAGSFNSPNMIIGTNTLVNTGSADDIFLAKYDANGNVLWAKCAGDVSAEYPLGVSSDAAGNVFITGVFMGSSLAIGSTTLVNAGTSDAVFIAKYDANGNPLWARGGFGDDGTAITTDATGNTYVAGVFTSTAITLGTYTLTNSGFGSMFLGKYDTNGNVLWARSSVGAGFTEGLGVTTDAAGDVYVTGDFVGATTAFGTYTITNPGGGTMFLTKYDAAGNVQWVRSAGGAGGHIGYSVSTYTGGVFVTGGLNSAVSVFGTYTLSTPTASMDPMFIVKYDLNGNVLCADVLPTGGDDQSGVSVDQLGNAYITGDFISNPFVLGTTSLTAIGSEDVFVTKFSCQVSVGIEVLNKEAGSGIYPNPNNGIFYLKSENELNNTELILFNSLGQKVHEQKIVQGINNINIPELRKGLYNYILFQDKQRVGDGKVVVE
jgi:hypothetical protein